VTRVLFRRSGFETVVRASGGQVTPRCRAKRLKTTDGGVGVSLRCAPGRASRAVGNETTVANGAEPPARQGLPHIIRRQCGRAGV